MPAPFFSLLRCNTGHRLPVKTTEEELKGRVVGREQALRQHWLRSHRSFFFAFLGPSPRHMEVPRLWGPIRATASSLATATATPDPSSICDLHHSPRQCQILNPLSEARDQTCKLMVPRRIHFCCATTGTPQPSPLTRSCRGSGKLLHI